MKRVYSREVDDIVSSTFLYNNGLSGRLLVDWTDSSYRKPSYRFEVVGEQGRLIADQHAYKLFLKAEDPTGEHKKGWSVRYLTDQSQPVRFYVRGNNEFTNQLDYFISRVSKRDPKNISSFAHAVQTDKIIDDTLANQGVAA